MWEAIGLDQRLERAQYSAKGTKKMEEEAGYDGNWCELQKASRTFQGGRMGKAKFRGNPFQSQHGKKWGKKRARE